MITKKNSFLIIVLVIAFDQLTKYLVLKETFWKFHIIENPGVLFGVSLPGFFNWLIIGLVLLIFIHLYVREFANPKTQTGFALVLGGALSNILDRLLDGSVTDFINLGISTMNFADVAIFVGLLYLVVTI